MASIDIAELRRLRDASKNGSKWSATTTLTYIDALTQAAPALLDELERLRKIAARVPERCCLTCLNDCRREVNRENVCDKWLPLDGEKEE